MAPGGAGSSGAEVAADLTPAWTTFEHKAPGWKMALLRPPERASQPLQILWLAADAPHMRARVRDGRRRNWLVFGERQRAVARLCAAEIEGWREQGFLPELDLVFSRDAAGGEYVQDRLRARADAVRGWIADGAVLYICGSLQGMAGGVEAALEDIIGHAVLDQLIEVGRYWRDVY